MTDHSATCAHASRSRTYAGTTPACCALMNAQLRPARQMRRRSGARLLAQLECPVGPRAALPANPAPHAAPGRRQGQGSISCQCLEEHSLNSTFDQSSSSSIRFATLLALRPEILTDQSFGCPSRLHDVGPLLHLCVARVLLIRGCQERGGTAHRCRRAAWAGGVGGAGADEALRRAVRAADPRHPLHHRPRLLPRRPPRRLLSVRAPEHAHRVRV